MKPKDVLKPCPFCGKEPAIDNNFAICVNDDCELSDYWSGLEDCSWNARPIEDALNARIAELEAEIETMKRRLAYLESWRLEALADDSGSYDSLIPEGA